MASSRDMDGDSQMGEVTSPSTDSEEAMFPSSKIEAGTVEPAKSQDVAGNMSSPPASQTLAPHSDGADGAMDIGEGEVTKKFTFGKDQEDSFVPGAGWNNKKAREEWQRAWNMLEDKTFSLKQFGDPFDDTQYQRKSGR